MNKWFYIAILGLAAALTGCTRTEVISAPQKAVAFQVGSYAPQTRAESIRTVDGIESFQSKGFLHAEGVEAVQPFFGANGETITYHAGTPATWTPSHDYYWPKSANSYVNFVSWYGGAPTTVSETSLVWNQTIATDANIMWADEAWRYNANAATYLEDDVEAGVPTLFHHALAQVRFQARLSKDKADNPETDDVKWAAKFTGLSLAAVKNQGSLTLANTDPLANIPQAWTGTGAEGAIEWVVAEGSTSASISMTSAGGIELGATAADILEYKSVLPQAITADMVLTVNYSVVTSYGSDATPSMEEYRTATVALSDFSGDITAWEMNRRYTYTIVINPDNGIITLIPVEKDWAPELEYNLNVE